MLLSSVHSHAIRLYNQLTRFQFTNTYMSSTLMSSLCSASKWFALTCHQFVQLIDNFISLTLTCPPHSCQLCAQLQSAQQHHCHASWWAYGWAPAATHSNLTSLLWPVVGEQLAEHLQPRTALWPHCCDLLWVSLWLSTCSHAQHCDLIVVTCCGWAIGWAPAVMHSLVTSLLWFHCCDLIVVTCCGWAMWLSISTTQNIVATICVGF